MIRTFQRVLIASAVSLRTIIGALILTAGVSVGAQAQTKWVLATGLPESNFLTHEIRAFVKDAEARTKGKIKFEMHENSTLIKRANIRRALELGQIQIGEIDTNAFGNEDVMYVLDTVPGLVPTDRHAEALWHVQRPYFMKSFQARGLTLLFALHWPGQGFSTKTPVQKPEDFKGLKLRVYSKTTQEMGVKMGFDAKILPFSEIPQAFSTGLVNSLYTSAQTHADFQAWDYVKYYYDAGRGSKLFVAANANAFKQLDRATQAALLQAARTIEARGYISTEAAIQETVAVLKKNGMTVQDLPDPIMKKFKEVGEEMLVDWRKQMSPEAVRVIEDYKALAAKM